MDVTLQAIATDNGTVETYPTPTAGAVLLVDATMADPAVSMTPVHAPNLQSVTLATSGAIENGAQLVRAEGVHQGIEARSRGLQVLPPKNYSDCHLDYYKNKADGRGCYPEYVDHQVRKLSHGARPAEYVTQFVYRFRFKVHDVYNISRLRSILQVI